MFVSKGAYDQVYKPLGWNPVEAPAQQEARQVVSEEPATPVTPKKRKARAAKE